MRALTLIATLFSLLACSGRPADTSPTGTCKAALKHKTIGSASGTTVGAVRTLGGGPSGGSPAEAHAFRGAKTSAPAAWCWVADGPHNWTAYAVGPHHQSVRLASYDGVTVAPTGAPEIK